MNIYAFIPLVATIAYIPLLLTTASVRPWNRQHRLFFLFLVAACLWSLTDYILRSHFFPANYNYLLFQILMVVFSWMAIQFHCFISSFFPPDRGRWLPFAYGSLIVIAILAGLGYLPQSVIADGDKLIPDYGWALFVVAAALLVLLLRNVQVLLPRLKNQENPAITSQTVSLLLCLGVLVIFMLMAIFPFGKEFPVSHVGNIINAVILSYAVVGQQLVDIRFVLRRGLIWLSIAVIGLASYWALLIGLHALLRLELTPGSMFAASFSGIIAVIIIYRSRDLIFRFMGKAFQGESYNYREQLIDFANKIHNVFSLKEQGGELLTLVTRAVGCNKACLLFRDPNGDYEVQLTKFTAKEDSLSNLKLRGDNPVVEYLKRERHPLTRESLLISPEFLGLWQQEKAAIENNHLALFMPLISRDRLIGIMVLDDKRSGHYNLEDYGLLQDITNRVAVSMEKEYLREQLKEREEELSVINRSNTIISSSLDIQRIYDNFIKELKQVVDVDWAAIAVIEETEIYYMAISTEIGSPWKVGERIPLKGSAVEWVANQCKPLIEADITIDPRFSTWKYYQQHSIRSIAYLPLIISNQVIGALTVASRKPAAYNSRHLKLLEQLASQVAMPIENARLYAKAERMARADSLTGLLNRRSLDEILPSEIGRHSRYGGVFSLIILDLDSFKLLNDNYGHLAGDELLRQIGVIMKNTIREADQAFRYGGDEFAILLPQTSLDASLKVAERIRQQTFARIEIGSIPISISLGLASWPADGVTTNDIIASADAALYEAKRSGGNRSVCSSASLRPSEKNKISVTDNQDSGALSAIFALAATVDTRDRCVHNHSKQVHEYAVAIGEGLGMNQLEINRLGTCALLHDVGKIGISDDILNKKEVLTGKEWELIRSHSQLGASIASHSSQLSPCIQGILHHHEKYNGEGYPDGLKGEEIPLESRILAIADAFATMTCARVYSKTLTYEAAIEELRNGAGKQFDPKLIQIFLSYIPKIIISHEKIEMGSEKN
jgi:diguanylate cyclase (GGDEF)-like protein